MKKDSDINSENRAEYLKEITGTFIVPITFPRTKKAFKQILSDIYHSLLEENQKDVDSLGIWIELNDSTKFENSISLQTLEDIKEYSKEDVNPIFEFLKMTIPK